MKLQNYLHTLLNRPGYVEQSDHWREGPKDSKVFKDVYDGKVWQDFKFYNGDTFLSDLFTYGPMLNIDW